MFSRVKTSPPQTHQNKKEKGTFPNPFPEASCCSDSKTKDITRKKTTDQLSNDVKTTSGKVDK